jgi:hypothetical protein
MRVWQAERDALTKRRRMDEWHRREEERVSDLAASRLLARLLVELAVVLDDHRTAARAMAALFPQREEQEGT